MIVRHFIAIAAVLALLPAADALAATAAGKPVHFSACTQAGAENACIVAKAEDGAIYNVTGATPSLKPDQWLQGTGTVSGRLNFCMQGNTIDHFVPDRNQAPNGCKP